MQTQSDPTQASGEWLARTATPRRSVFGNYKGKAEPDEQPAEGCCAAPTDPGSLQQSIDAAVARTFMHRFLALAYQDPSEQSWRDLSSAAQLGNLAVAAALLGCETAAKELANQIAASDCDTHGTAHFMVFGHAARGRCPLNEIEYGDVKADPLFQPHRLADLAAFYRAFGLEVTADADERQDHICLELEFMSVLSAKEAYAIEHQLDSEELAICRAAQKKFLREHLGRWTPAFSRRLAQNTDDAVLQRLAELTRVFVESECARLNVKAGSDDLLLRPIDEAAENMCASCGLGQLPPGAAEPAEV